MNQTKMNPKQPECLTLTAAMDITAAAEGADGKAPLPRFSMVAYTGGAMRVAGWRYPVIVDLAGLAIPSQSRPIRFGHDAGSGVGHTDAIAVFDGKLIASGTVSRDTPAAKEVVASARNGFPWQASIGASVEQFEFVKENQAVLVNGREFSGPVNVVRKATLGEISFVDLGADGNTSANVAASAQQESNFMEEKTTTSTGIEGQDKIAGKDVGAPSISDKIEAAAIDPVAEMRIRAAAEQERITAVRKVCGDQSDIAAKAIREGWDVVRTELEVLRASRPTAPAVHSIESGTSTEMLEAACMLTAGLSSLESSYEEKTLEAASKRFRGGIGLQELLLEAAWANGYTGRNFRDTRAVLRCAFSGGGIQAGGGFSTIDIGGILSNVANKFLLEGFFSVERT